MNHFRQLLFAFAVGVLLSAGLVPVASAAPPEAPVLAAPSTGERVAIEPLSASGGAIVGAFCYTYKSVKICPVGSILFHRITGSGKNITYQEASLSDLLGNGTAGGNYCNWRIDWVYYTDAVPPVLYRRDTGPTHNVCEGMFYEIGRKDSRNVTVAYYGSACAVFYVNGTERGRQCHSITR